MSIQSCEMNDMISDQDVGFMKCSNWTSQIGIFKARTALGTHVTEGTWNTCSDTNDLTKSSNPCHHEEFLALCKYLF